MAYVYDIVDPAELNAFARAIDPLTLNYTLGTILPDQMRQTVEYEFMLMTQVRDEIAAYRAPDTPPKTIGRPGISKQKGEIPVGSVKRTLTEQNRYDLEKLQTGAVSQAFRDAIFDDAAAVTNSALGRLELAKGEALTKGRVSFTNDRGFDTGVTITYGTTTTITAPSTKWDVTATSTPIPDMRAQVLQFMNANNGMRPAFALTSQSVIDYVLAADSVRSLFIANGVTPAMINETMLNNMLRNYGLPPLVPYDVSVNIAGTTTRVTGVKELTWLPTPNVDNFGATLHGVTVEAMELVGLNYMLRDEAPGVTVMVDKKTQPTQIDTVATFASVPVIKDTAKIGNVTVLT
jgi:hypothetical protein